MKVYVLELEYGKYYVGKTTDVARRFQQHLSGSSSSWTRMFRPIRIINVIHDCDGLDEDRITVKYMIKHGIHNVRGGPYISRKLSFEEVTHIHRRIRMAMDLCLICGSNGHFANKCNHQYTLEENCFICLSKTHFTEDCEFN